MRNVTATIHVGHALDVLRRMPSDSVHCAVCSPPYWGLRDYGLEPQVWGGNPSCDHEFATEELRVEVGSGNWTQAENGPGLASGRHQTRFRGDAKAARENTEWATVRRGFCRCGAWLGSLGLEPTPDLYVQHVVEVFREVRRVLRPDGTCWLNLGDSYASGMRSFYDDDRHKYATARAHDMRPPTPDGLKPKDLIGTPWRVAFALQADGWWLRSAITWAKGISFLPGYSGSVMPESVDDRPTRASEMVFLLAKSERYFVDMDAIREPIAESSIMRINQATLGLRVRQKTADNPHFGGRRQAPEPGEPNAFHPLGRNVRDVWAINPEPFDYEMCRVCKRVYDGREYEMLADAPRDGDALPKKVCRCGRSDEWLSHFAVFPQALVLPCVLAGTSEKGCCPQCGAPWERVVEGKSEYAFNIRVRDDKAGRTDRKSHFDRGVNPDEVAAYDERSYGGGGRATIGWRPTCPCGVEETIPATVLDPFAGSGTTLLVAAKNGRHSVGVELQNDYIPLIQKRLEPLETDLIHPAKVVIVECPTTDTTERRYTTGDALPATSPLSPGEKTECTARGDATG